MWLRWWFRTALPWTVFVPIAAFAELPIHWSQPVVSASVLQSTLQTKIISFTATQDLGAVDVAVAPPQQRVIAADPVHFNQVSRGKSYQIKLLFTVPDDNDRRYFAGILLLRSSAPPARVLLLPLPIVLTVTPLTADVIPRSIGVPSLDRILVENGVRYAANELIVCVTPETTAEHLRQLAVDEKATFIGQDSFGCYQLHTPFSGLARALALVQHFETYPFVRYALPAFFSEAQSSELAPDDPSWYAQNQPKQAWAQQAIRLPAAWNQVYTSPTDSSATAGIKLAIVDDGWSAHEDINYAAESTNPGFSSEHGTPVAGLASATGGNTKGSAGALWQSHLMLKGSFYRDFNFDPTARNSMAEAFGQGARIINYSYARDWSTLCHAGTNPLVLQNMVLEEKRFWRDLLNIVPPNVSLIFAAGNFRDNVDSTVPAILSNEFSNVISVAATDRLGDQASYSNYGPVSVWAPGGDKPTLLRDPDNCPDRTPADSTGYIKDPLAAQGDAGAQLYAAKAGNTYGYVTGTSDAAPLVAGVAGLMLSKNSLLTGSQIREIIVNSADDTGRADPSGSEIKIINACRAVRTASGSPMKFALASSNPTSGSANIPLTQSVFLSFNIPINQNNLSSLLPVFASTGDRVSGTILVLNDQSVEFIPSTHLLPGIAYLVDLRAITDKYCGDLLSGSTAVTFTTSQTTTVGPQFDFAVDFLSVAGNVNGGAGFFDDFNDGSLTTPPTSNIVCNQNTAPVSESGGFLHLSSADGANTFSPGSLVDNCILGQDATAFRLNDGSGNSVITASFRADVPGPGQGAGLQLFTAGPTNEIVNINFSTGPLVVAVAQPNNGPQSVQAVPIDLTGVQRVMLRLTFNDATNQVTHSYSLNGGATFIDIVLPQPGKVMTTGSQAVVSVFGSVQLPSSQ
jgi:hypothetical protein